MCPGVSRCFVPTRETGDQIGDGCSACGVGPQPVLDCPIVRPDGPPASMTFRTVRDTARLRAIFGRQPLVSPEKPALPARRRLPAPDYYGERAHAAFSGQTPDEMYFGRGDRIPRDLAADHACARAARLKSKRELCCSACRPPLQDPPGLPDPSANSRVLHLHEEMSGMS